MTSTYGHSLHLSVFGQSHSEAIGCSLDGMPAGVPIDLDALQAFCDRRAPGRDETSTKRKEADRVHVLCGLHDGHTCGAPLAAIIENTNTRSADYSGLRRVPRPGHADWPAYVRYGNWHDVAGGGHFSGRLTAPLCIAGGIAIQALAHKGIQVSAHIQRVADVEDARIDDLAFDEAQRKAVLQNSLPCIDESAAQAMRRTILAARDDLDSVGGIVECAVYGVPAGIGDPMFDGIENRIAQIAFGIPAVKGIEFGAGFAVATMRGSQDNDPYRVKGGTVSPVSNNAGGALGGITTGAPIVFRLAFKPTPSIAKEQLSVDLENGCDTELSIRGRHDPCIVARAVPVVEAAAAFSVLDAMLDDGRYFVDPHGNSSLTRS